MGWAILFLLALAVFLGVRFLVKPARGVQELLGAALMIGIAGYAWQGRPTLAGQPTVRPDATARPASFAEAQSGMMERFGKDAQVLATADAFLRQGLPDYAVGVIRGGLSRNPKSAELWVGLGNALIVYSNGLITPAARLAFDRAAALQPDHPAPPYFLGLAYAQNGELDRAERIWRALLARSSADAPWRGEVEDKLMAIDQARGTR